MTRRLFALGFALALAAAGPLPAQGGGTVQFERAAVSVGEAQGAIPIRVTRTGGTSGVVEVFFGVVGGTAQPTTLEPGDYHIPPVCVCIPEFFYWFDGDNSPRTLWFVPDDDLLAEGDETVVLRLEVYGAEPGTVSETTITIVDDDLRGIATGVPTLGVAAQLALASLLAVAGWWAIRRL